jgi:hypothetical protein
MEIWDANARWKRFLALKSPIQALAEIGLDAHGLQDENAHPDQSILGWIVPVLHGVEENENDEIMRPVGVDYEGLEALVALQGLPKEHNQFRGPDQGFLAPREVRSVCLHLHRLGGPNCDASYLLVQYSRHSVDKELEVLRSVQSAKEVPKVVFRDNTMGGLWNWVADEDEEQLEAVDDQQLLVVAKHDVIVRDSPGGRIVFDCRV